jgi:sugar transferase (PEP-CTERM system associated)
LLNLFRSRVSFGTLVQLAVELSWLFAAAIFVLQVHDGLTIARLNIVVPAFMFALVMVALNGVFGLYRRSTTLSWEGYALRVLLALLIAIPVSYFGAELLPGGAVFQENLGLALLIAAGGLLLVRHVMVLPLVGIMRPHRVLVLGTGPEAQLVEASLASASSPGIRIIGFHPLAKAQRTQVSRRRIIANTGSLEATVKRLAIDEIIVAVREQRGGVLPLRELLDCRLSGVQVTDLARFFERVHGKVPIESLKVSWLIYGDGYRQGWLRSVVKRTFDIFVSILLLILTLPIIFVTALMIALDNKGEVVYRQKRVGRAGETFTLLKFRSMDPDAEKDGGPSWASVNDVRITPVGRFIRRTRIDELPQLINVLRGEMSFVGPRPERPEFVGMLTEQIPFYAVRHSVKPGITGWAQVRYSYGANVEQAVKKLEYDLYYVKNHTLLLDLLILLETVRVVMLAEGAR